MKTDIFREAIDLTEAQADAENRVLRNVVLIRAGMSKNRRHYSESVLQAAAPLFEDVPAFNDHDFIHKVTNTTGFYKNVRYENGALKADRYFTPNQAGNDVWLIAQDIVSGRAPKTLAGLSIAAVGTGKSRKFDDGEGLEVESISAAHSVDDVSSPAAGGAYLSASATNNLLADVLATMTYEDWTQAQPEYTERLTKQLKTARQDDALKSALAETEVTRLALQEAQATIATLTTERETAVQNEARASRALAVEKALSKATLPEKWKSDLRKTLVEAEPDQWASIIDSEISKARAAGYKPKVDVTGAGQQVAPNAEHAPQRSAPDWEAITASPVAFMAWRESLSRSS